MAPVEPICSEILFTHFQKQIKKMLSRQRRTMWNEVIFGGCIEANIDLDYKITQQIKCKVVPMQGKSSYFFSEAPYFYVLKRKEV